MFILFSITLILLSILCPHCPGSNATDASTLISHTSSDQLNSSFSITEYMQRLQNANATSFSYPLDIMMNMLKELASFDFGRFMLVHQGLNGFWTQYHILIGPERQKSSISDLEYWIIHNSPLGLATRERYYIFKLKLQHFLNLKSIRTISHDGIIKPLKLVSVPCGLMDDLLSLDYSDKLHIELYGIDLDEKSIKLASENTLNYSTSLQANNVDVQFVNADAFKINQSNLFSSASKFDIVTSNGLNVYVTDDDKVVELYRQFRFLLKPGGILITSFIVPPSEWQLHSEEDAIKSKVLFNYIIQVNWCIYRTEELTRQQLNDAGFIVLNVEYDSQHMYPTITAEAVEHSAVEHSAVEYSSVAEL